MLIPIGAATVAQIAANPNRLSGGLGIQSATATTVTLSLQDRHTYPLYVGATLDMFGYGQRTITAFANSVATVSPAWGTIPPNGAGYRILSQKTPPGASWYWSIEPWSSPYQNGSGFKLALQYDRSDAQDCSDMITVASFGPSRGDGQNGDDGEVYLYGNILAVISGNTLQSPPKPEDWNPGVPGTPRGVAATAPLDVGPQFIFHRAVNAPVQYSALGSIQWDGLDKNGVHVNWGYMQAQVIDDANAAQKGQLFTSMSSMTYGWLWGGYNGGGGHFEDGWLHDAGAGTLHLRRLGIGHQWTIVP